MSTGTRRLLAIVLIIIIIIGVSVAAYFLFFRKTDPTMRVRRLGGEEIVDHRVADYRDSSLRIYPNGAFEIELIQTISDDEKIILFVGIGTYTKTGNAYTFTYIDSFSRNSAGELVRKQNYTPEDPYPIISGRVQFDFQGVLFYFA